jgi:putative spermidine/putrescine transport system substrate-binding protein
MTYSRSLRVAASAALAVAVGLTALTACGAPSSKKTSAPPPASALGDKPSRPVSLNILDVAGNLQLTKAMIEAFKTAHPEIVGSVTYTTGTAPQLAAKIKAEEDGGNPLTSLVLTGTDGLSAGIKGDLWTNLSGYYAGSFPGLMDNYQTPAAAMAKLAQDKGIELVYYPSGPLIEYNPAAVPDPPTTTDALLAWAKAHPGRFEYARPANSGPGRTFLMGLPYLLGDSDPKDPTNGWAKTWDYLQQLSPSIKQYQTGTTATMKDLANGTVDMIASTTGWDINPRVLGTVPNTMKVTSLQGFHWVSDAQYGVIPKGVSNDTLIADIQLLKWMLKPDQQAKAYDNGYFYPGPAVKGVTLSMAPDASQQAIQKFGRPEYDALIANNPVETSLPADSQVTAFDKWDQLIGSKK